MKIEILGTGCKKCKRLYEEAQKALASTGIEAELVKVEDLAAIAARGVMSTPALVVDGTVRASGRLLKADEIARILKESAS